MLNILFVCGKNKWRSPTAECIYRNDPRVNVRSAGIRSGARHQISQKDVEWAGLIVVMEQEYKRWIRQQFRHIKLPPIESLDIPDDFTFMDKELIELIKTGTESFIK